MIETLGYLSQDRLAGIPPEFHSRHEFLIYLHFQLQELLLKAQDEANRDFSFKPDEIEGFDQAKFKEDPIKYAAENVAGAKQPVINDVSLALAADFLAFTYTALTAFEKRLFTVGYANLRKPFEETLLLLSWICADDKEFFDRFLNDPAKDLNNLTREKRKEIYEKARSAGAHFAKIDGDIIESLIYDKSNEHGLAVLTHKAIHLTTSRKTLRTEDMNLNFIFKHPQSNDVYETGYKSIALVYLYAYEVFLTVCERMIELPENFKSWLDLVLWSSYEVLFLDTEPKHYKQFDDLLGDTISCIHCGMKCQIHSRSVPRFLITEQFSCENCGEEQSFPLFWLFCHQSNEEDEESPTHNSQPPRQSPNA